MSVDILGTSWDQCVGMVQYCHEATSSSSTWVVRAQELCESRGGRPGLPVPNKPTVSVDVKQHWTKTQGSCQGYQFLCRHIPQQGLDTTVWKEGRNHHQKTYQWSHWMMLGKCYCRIDGWSCSCQPQSHQQRRPWRFAVSWLLGLPLSVSTSQERLFGILLSSLSVRPSQKKTGAIWHAVVFSVSTSQERQLPFGMLWFSLLVHHKKDRCHLVCCGFLC